MDQKASLSALRDAAIDRIVDIVMASGSVGELTDKYFTNTRLVVEANGDTEVTYAIFLRRRSISALEPVVRLIRYVFSTSWSSNTGTLMPATSPMTELGALRRVQVWHVAGKREAPDESTGAYFNHRAPSFRKGTHLEKDGTVQATAPPATAPSFDSWRLQVLS